MTYKSIQMFSILLNTRKFFAKQLLTIISYYVLGIKA